MAAETLCIRFWKVDYFQLRALGGAAARLQSETRSARALRARWPDLSSSAVCLIPCRQHTCVDVAAVVGHAIHDADPHVRHSGPRNEACSVPALFVCGCQVWTPHIPPIQIPSGSVKRTVLHYGQPHASALRACGPRRSLLRGGGSGAKRDRIYAEVFWRLACVPSRKPFLKRRGRSRR